MFLHDRVIAARFAALTPVEEDRPVLEIGPGTGAITRELLAAGHHVVCVEIDPRLAQGIAQLGARVRVVTGSILDCPPADLVAPPVRVVGALPYHLSGAILRWLADHADVMDTAALILQEEVVGRTAAPAGHRDRGVLSVIMQSVYHVKPLFRIHSGAFTPRPRVGSRAVLLTRRSTGPTVEACRPVWDTARLLFMHRRKMIRTSIARAFGDDACRRLEAAGADLTVRPEQLSLGDIATLASALLRGA